MSDVLLLYLFTRLDIIHKLSSAGAIIGGAVLVALAVIFFIAKFELISDEAMENPHAFKRENIRRSRATVEAMRKLGRACFMIWLPFALVAIAAPTKKDAAIIIGGKIAIDVGRSDVGKEIGAEVLAAIRAQLREAAAK